MKALEEVFAETMPGDGVRLHGHGFQGQKAQQGVSPVLVFGFSCSACSSFSPRSMRVGAYRSACCLGRPWWWRSAFGALMVGHYENNVCPDPDWWCYRTRRQERHSHRGVRQDGLGEEGKPLLDATLEGAKLRLWPILMTSFAFILGCVPWPRRMAQALSRQVMGLR